MSVASKYQRLVTLIVSQQQLLKIPCLTATDGFPHQQGESRHDLQLWDTSSSPAEVCWTEEVLEIMQFTNFAQNHL